MSKVILDENQNVVDEFAERNDEIKAALEEKMQILLEETASNAYNRTKRRKNERCIMRTDLHYQQGQIA